MAWGFYGRQEELRQLGEILARGRWFFVKLTGRRRIGKTALIQQALPVANRRVFYLQVPDSGPAGVLSSVADALTTFQVDPAIVPRPSSLRELAGSLGKLARAGFVVALDEFQYFNRERLREFCSHLQQEVDALSADAAAVPGGLLVLGSIQTEVNALLEDRAAPLYNRTTDEIVLGHLDVESLIALLAAHAEPTPERLLFLWNLFEGVPKFYRDCYEQGVLGAGRAELLERAFFLSSSPLRTEADNWFLKELHGRYDVVLKYIARHSGCLHGDLISHVREVSPETGEQVGGYLKVLSERFQLIERRQPIFAKASAKRGRYYLTDNFLRSWLAALANPISAIHFVPAERLMAQADERLADIEGHTLEKLVGLLYEERSRKGLGDFALSARIQGFWDRGDTEIDLVAIDEVSRRIRLASCKRSAERLVGDIVVLDGHVARFMAAHPKYAGWRVEKVGIAPSISADIRARLAGAGHLAQDLIDLTAEFPVGVR
ncbi:MAG: ATP-binding protein [Deltaproteobacteria bacterium]|nr:ATP-binding protein [Deltaproteobacteria bacterium]